MVPCQHTCRDTLAFPDQTEQEVFSSNVVVIQASGFIYCQLDHLFSARRQTNFAQHNAVAAPDNELDSLAHFV